MIIERLTNTLNGKRLLAVDFLYFSSTEKSTKVHVHDKRETTHFDVETAEGKMGFLPFAGKKT